MSLHPHQTLPLLTLPPLYFTSPLHYLPRILLSFYTPSNVACLHHTLFSLELLLSPTFHNISFPILSPSDLPIHHSTFLLPYPPSAPSSFHAFILLLNPLSLTFPSSLSSTHHIHILPFLSLPYSTLSYLHYPTLPSLTFILPTLHPPHPSPYLPPSHSLPYP